MPNQTKKDPRGLAVASLVLGLIRLLTGPVLFPITFILGLIPFLGMIISLPLYILLGFFLLIGFPMDIVGIILGIKGRKSSKRKLSIAGIILCAIGLAFDVLVLIGILILASIAIIERYS